MEKKNKEVEINTKEINIKRKNNMEEKEKEEEEYEIEVIPIEKDTKEEGDLHHHVPILLLMIGEEERVVEGIE
jgi:hypothetical protein